MAPTYPVFHIRQDLNKKARMVIVRQERYKPTKRQQLRRVSCSCTNTMVSCITVDCGMDGSRVIYKAHLPRQRRKGIDRTLIEKWSKDCPICLEPIIKDNVHIKLPARAMPCDHLYHAKCIHDLCEHYEKEKGIVKCALCREPINEIIFVGQAIDWVYDDKVQMSLKTYPN